MEMQDADFMFKYTYLTYANIKCVLDDINLDSLWSDKEHILDIGCGPGVVSTNILSDYAPKNATMVGGDISKNMINFAKKHFPNPRISFQIMDITDWEQLKKWKETFTTIFCFHVLQRIDNISKAYENMYKLLKPGGKLIFLYPTFHPLERIFPHLAKIPKYEEYAEAISKMTINITHREDHLSFTKDVLKNIGFDLLVCKEKEMEVTFESTIVLSDLMRAIFPLSRILPSDLLENAVEDSIKLIDECELIKLANGTYEDIYKVLMVLANKKI